MKAAGRVLVVDDEVSIRTLAERVLHGAGYQTAVAAGGPAALQIVETEAPFDLLLADVVMPDMRGDELARRLMRREPDLKVLYLTGYSDQLFAERTTLGENETFIEKPVTTQGLVEAVSFALSGHVRRLNPEVLAGLTQPRRLRVAAPAITVRLGEIVGRLVNVSATGALVRLPHALPLDGDWSMRIETASDAVDMRVCVVRSHPVAPIWPDMVGQHQGREYMVALAFVDPATATEHVLKALCGDAFGKHE